MEKTKYVSTWRKKWITANANSIDDFIKTFEGLVEMFKEWKEVGVKLYPGCATGDDYAEFYTEDMEVAIKVGFTGYLNDDKSTLYLQTDTGEFVKVPEKKLEDRRI